jgi:hypothetical protein
MAQTKTPERSFLLILIDQWEVINIQRMTIFIRIFVITMQLRSY